MFRRRWRPPSPGTLRSATRSCHRPVFEVGDAGRLDGPDLLELHLRVPEVVEEASTVAEHHRNDVELKFVQQSRCQVLLSDVGAAPKHDVSAAGGPCLIAPAGCLAESLVFRPETPENNRSIQVR